MPSTLCLAVWNTRYMLVLAEGSTGCPDECLRMLVILYSISDASILPVPSCVTVRVAVVSSRDSKDRTRYGHRRIETCCVVVAPVSSILDLRIVKQRRISA